MSDQFSVTGAVTPANPATGDTVTVTITGDNTHSEAGSIGPITLSIGSPSGGATQITVDAVPYTKVSHEPVTITGVTDPTGRTWAVAANGLTATAVA